MKYGRSSVIMLLIILVFAALIVYLLYTNGVITLFNKEHIVYESNDLFFVTTANKKQDYGICKSDGTVILECKYKVLLRNGKSVYINDGVDSYVFFLDSNKSISLGGKESDVALAYDKNTHKPLPYFILKYGNNSSAVYRIYTDKGVRYSNKDFTSLESTYEFLDADVTFKTTNAPRAISENYNVKLTFSYPTEQMRTQYVVSKRENKEEIYGIVDETGRIVLDLACSNIIELQGRTKGAVVSRNAKTYLFFSNEKLLEVDSGFEFLSGMDFVYQKKGDTVNRVYNLNGEIVIDGIFKLNKEFFSYPTIDSSAYMFTKEDNKYHLYNITLNKKYDTVYTNLAADYIKDYSEAKENVWTTGFMYVQNNIPYCVDFNTMKDCRMNILADIYSVLDIGYKYKIK